MARLASNWLTCAHLDQAVDACYRGTKQRLQEAFGLPILSAKEAARSTCLRVHMYFLQDKALAFFINYIGVTLGNTIL